jgi:hypothetical protein
MCEIQCKKKLGIITSKAILFVRITVHLMVMIFSNTGKNTAVGIFCKNQ